MSSDFEGTDLDRMTARAWTAYQVRLGDAIADMVDDDVVTVQVESAIDGTDAVGCAPYVQVCGWGVGLVRAEVSSNHHLAEQHRLDERAASVVLEMGWAEPSHRPDEEPDGGSPNYWVDLGSDHADELAAMIVGVLRYAFLVTHPAFLAGDLHDEEPGTDGPGEAPEEPLAVRPRDRDHLRSLVDDALVPIVGGVPEHDQDDDVPVSSGRGLVWVRVLRDAPAVHLFTLLVEDVADPERAAFEVAVLNRDQRFFTFVLVEDAVMAHLYLPAYPFAPLHLRIMIDRLAEMADGLDVDLAVRVAGRRAFEPATVAEEDQEHEDEDEQEDEALHPALATIIELERESPGSVDPVLAASICEMDRDLVLGLIVSAVGHRLPAVADLLRRALRVVVEDRASAQPGHAYDVLGVAHRRGRDRDVPLPGLDDGEQPLWDQ